MIPLRSPLAWTIVHPLDESSPIADLTTGECSESLHAEFPILGNRQNTSDDGLRALQKGYLKLPEVSVNGRIVFTRHP